MILVDGTKTLGEYSSIGALDLILKAIYIKDEAMIGIYVNEISDYLKSIEKTTLSKYEIIIIIERLISDKNAINEAGRIKLTFDGRFLYENNGYTGLDALRVADEDRLKKLSIEQVRQGKALVRLTLILAIGAAIASVYYIIETLRIFYPDSFPRL